MDDEALKRLVKREPIPDRLIRDLGLAPLTDELPPGSGSHELARRRGTDELTEAEREVLTAVSHGLTNQMVADLRNRSIHTIKTELRRAQYALRAKNATHAVATALRHGIID